jgi:two-component system alkaline phosphatase synthesis response regulator PhoP
MQTSNEAKKILIVEDEPHIAEGIMLNLELAGHSVQWAANGVIGLEMWKSFKPDLVVLDIMMPELDGHGVLKKIRAENQQLPVLILSAKNESVDKVKAFKEGVDDYLGKPFALDEFMARVDRLLIKASWLTKNDSSEISGADREGEATSFGHNTVYPKLLKAQTKKGEINLTEQEVKLLNLFFSHPGLPLKRAQLLEVGWGYSEDTNTRTLDNFMVRFRKYFEKDPKKPKYFCSVRGVGYLWDPTGKGR